MNKIILTLSFISLLVINKGFTQVGGGAADDDGIFVVDSIPLDNDTLILYSDRSWEYLSNIRFDGILFPDLHNFVSDSTSYGLKLDWNTKQVYSRENDLTKLKDSIWICLGIESDSSFCLPFDGLMTSKFGYRKSRFHKGVDIDLETGDPVKSAFDGKVRYAGKANGYGNLVVIRHYNGLETYYGHLDKINVLANDEIKAGEILGLGGNTGKSTGSHLHFEIRFYHQAIDPKEIIDFKTGKIKSENFFVHRDLFYWHRNYHRFGPHNRQLIPKYYKVKKGDTLYRISKKYGTSIRTICEVNGIRSNKVLKIGQLIKLRT